MTLSSCRMIKHCNEYFNHDLSLLRYNKVLATPPISTMNRKSLQFENGGKNIIYDVNDFKLDSLDRVADLKILNFFFRRDVLFVFDPYVQYGCCEYCDSIEYSSWKHKKELYIVGFEQKTSNLQCKPPVNCIFAIFRGSINFARAEVCTVGWLDVQI